MTASEAESADGKPGQSVERRGGYVWAPFERGNRAQRQAHGVYDAERVKPVSDQFVESLPALVAAGLAPAYLIEPTFVPDVQAWAWVEGQCVLARRWLDEHGSWDNKGQVRDVAKHLETLERRASKARAALGLTPASREQLRLTIGQTTSIAANLDRMREQSAHLVPDFADDESDAAS